MTRLTNSGVACHALQSGLVCFGERNESLIGVKFPANECFCVVGEDRQILNSGALQKWKFRTIFTELWNSEIAVSYRLLNSKPVKPAFSIFFFVGYLMMLSV
jgi:hypothetical protein